MGYLEVMEAITKYGILVVIAAIFLWFYWQDREDARKNRAEDRKLREEQISKSTEIKVKLSEIIAGNTVKIDTFAETLKSHEKSADTNFDSLGDKIEKIDSKLETLQETTKELATKEMAEEIKKEVRNLKRD